MIIETIGDRVVTMPPLDLSRIRTLYAADGELQKRSAELARLEGEDDPTAFAMSLAQREQLAKDIAALTAMRSKLVAIEPQRQADEEELDRLREIANGGDPAAEADRERRVVAACRELAAVLDEMDTDVARRERAAREARTIGRRLGYAPDTAVPGVSRSGARERQRRQIARAIGAEVPLAHARRLPEFVTPDTSVSMWRPTDEQLGPPPRTGHTVSSKTPHAPWPDPNLLPGAVYSQEVKANMAARALEPRDRVVVGGREIVEEIG